MTAGGRRITIFMGNTFLSIYVSSTGRMGGAGSLPVYAPTPEMAKIFAKIRRIN